MQTLQGEKENEMKYVIVALIFLQPACSRIPVAPIEAWNKPVNPAAIGPCMRDKRCGK
jgi:hypothetical protein